MRYSGLSALLACASILLTSCQHDDRRADAGRLKTESAARTPAAEREVRAGIFQDSTHLLTANPAQRNYGIAVTDLDGDDSFEFVVAGFGNPNLAFGWNGARYVEKIPSLLSDPSRDAIGVAACDVDGDGREELYVLNTDSYAGTKRFGDRLFDAGPGGAWTNLFEAEGNEGARNLTAGRSVACVDRMGTGRYSVFVANYGGPMRLYELDDEGSLRDIAAEAGVARTTGGRGIISGPILSARMDLFLANERGPNFMFRNQGDGTFVDVAAAANILDPGEHGRGIALLDANEDGRLDIAYGNWAGPHRLFIQREDHTFADKAPPEMAAPSRIRTVLAADFDNDGYVELFFNNIGEANRLFRRDPKGQWVVAPIGDALEPEGLGTGAAVADLNGDGRLELLVAHGESGAQPLTLFETQANDHHWLRVLPRTTQGAPARGALVELVADGRTQRRVIDSGSGYLCQMEPVAHFGLGDTDKVSSVRVVWPDGATRTLAPGRVDATLELTHP
ncbi:MAG: CRTAC1 family protein [Myxococcota bacterium]